MAHATRGRFNFVAMLLAFSAMGGFLCWLSITAEPTERPVASEEETAQAVSLAAFAQNPAIYEGDLIVVDGVEVQSLLGSQAFFVALPDDSPYPVRLASSMGTPGTQVAPNAMGRVTGTVHMMTDSVLDAWAAEALFADDAQREAAAASSTFLLAQEVELVGADEAESGSNGTQGGGA